MKSVELKNKKGMKTNTKYRTIVIDPPWKIQMAPKTLFTKSGLATKLPYNTMTDQEILKFPINDFADESCLLFLWTIHSKIRFAFDMLDQWNFKYIATGVWYKHGQITSNGIQFGTEFYLIAYRGKRVDLLKYVAPMPIHISVNRTRHSEKPQKFYDILLKHTPAPRIDIFGRRRHYGFDAYGDQVEADSQKRL